MIAFISHGILSALRSEDSASRLTADHPLPSLADSTHEPLRRCFAVRRSLLLRRRGVLPTIAPLRLREGAGPLPGPRRGGAGAHVVAVRHLSARGGSGDRGGGRCRDAGRSLRGGAADPAQYPRP